MIRVLLKDVSQQTVSCLDFFPVSFFTPYRLLHCIQKLFVIFKPFSHCFEETLGFDLKASFAKSSTIGSNQVNIIKEF